MKCFTSNKIAIEKVFIIVVKKYKNCSKLYVYNTAVNRDEKKINSKFPSFFVGVGYIMHA